MDAMTREYVTEVAKLEGTDPAPALAALEAAKAGGGAEGKQGKWLDKEKQEQLVRGALGSREPAPRKRPSPHPFHSVFPDDRQVHTAPVLSPSAKSPSFGGGGEGGGASGPDSGARPSPAASSRPGARGTSVVPRAPGLSAAVKRQLHDLRQQFEAAKKVRGADAHAPPPLKIFVKRILFFPRHACCIAPPSASVFLPLFACDALRRWSCSATLPFDGSSASGTGCLCRWTPWRRSDSSGPCMRRERSPCLQPWRSTW